MRNALEHGVAHDVKIGLVFNGNELVLTIRDDGKGFRANGNGNGAGMGLRIMRYRAQCIGGRWAVGSHSAKGTIVSCPGPLEPQPTVIRLPGILDQEAKKNRAASILRTSRAFARDC